MQRPAAALTACKLTENLSPREPPARQRPEIAKNAEPNNHWQLTACGSVNFTRTLLGIFLAVAYLKDSYNIRMDSWN
jgi:hypothetical protein